MTRDPDCIFCKIIAGEIPGHVIWEDDDHIALLDIFPLRRAQTVLFPKKHVPSSIFAMSDEDYAALMKAAKAVSNLLEEKLDAERTMVVGEGLEIDHVHLKLYPRFHGEHGLVHPGKQARNESLAELAAQIRGQ